NLRVWDVAKGVNWKEADGKENVALTRWPEAKQLISGSLAGANGQLQVWKYSPSGGLQLDKQRATFPFRDETFFIPRAVSLVSSEANAKPDYGAVVLWAFRQKTPMEAEYRLSLVDLDNFGIAKEISLWKSKIATPTVAASSQGYLAVAGNYAHDIHIYSVKNLLANQTEPQIIHSVGSTFRYVSFATKGKDLGSLLSETRRKPAADGRAVLYIFQGQDLVRGIKLAKGLAVTDYALLPPRPPLDVPVLAVASHDLGQPMLQLYNAKTGEQTRQLTGHMDPISCL